MYPIPLARLCAGLLTEVTLITFTSKDKTA
jgi:hypothetical protein